MYARTGEIVAATLANAPIPPTAEELRQGITGQIFGARKNEVILISQPRPLRTMHRDGGWTPQALADQMLPAFRPAAREDS